MHDVKMLPILKPHMIICFDILYDYSSTNKLFTQQHAHSPQFNCWKALELNFFLSSKQTQIN